MSLNLPEIFAATAIVLAIVFVCFVWMRNQQQATEQLQAELAKWIAKSGLDEVQQGFLTRLYIPKLLEYRRRSRWANGRYYLLSKSSIVYMFAAGVVSTAVGALFRSYWAVGLVLIALLQAASGVTSAFDRIESNSATWRDYRRIADELEESLQELLTKHLDLDIQKRWGQFTIEYEAIMDLERQLFDQRVSQSQQAANQAIDAAQDHVRQIRQDFRAQPKAASPPNLSQAKPIAPETTIEGTNITPAQYIERSMAGDNLTADWTDNKFDAPGAW